VPLKSAVRLALEAALITLGPLHVNAVDVRFVLLEAAAYLALEVTLVALEPLHIDAVDVRFVPFEAAVLLALEAALITLEPLHVNVVDVRFVLSWSTRQSPQSLEVLVVGERPVSNVTC